MVYTLHCRVYYNIQHNFIQHIHIHYTVQHYTIHLPTGRALGKPLVVSFSWIRPDLSYNALFTYNNSKGDICIYRVYSTCIIITEFGYYILCMCVCILFLYAVILIYINIHLKYYNYNYIYIYILLLPLQLTFGCVVNTKSSTFPIRICTLHKALVSSLAVKVNEPSRVCVVYISI